LSHERTVSFNAVFHFRSNHLISAFRLQYADPLQILIALLFYAIVSQGQVTEQSFDKVIAVNFKMPYFTIQKALPLVTQGSSVIINASVGARKG
jgi:NAD(P)-dependent dehydrogenase (short-subunit alcohol dehydrogenase family)